MTEVKIAPVWAVCRAQDLDGRWYWFGCIPKRGKTCWRKEGTQYRFDNQDYPNTYWGETLTRLDRHRPSVLMGEELEDLLIPILNESTSPWYSVGAVAMVKLYTRVYGESREFRIIRCYHIAKALATFGFIRVGKAVIRKKRFTLMARRTDGVNPTIDYAVEVIETKLKEMGA